VKQKDILIIIGVAIVSAIFSYVVSNALFGGGNIANLTAPKVTPISAEFPTPDERYFNSGSLNPTKTITIGDSTNTQPF
jgi:hypothetical protein